MHVTLRQAAPDDLPALNRVVEASFMTWELPERVKRLSLPSYLYNEMDLRHLQIMLAERDAAVVGVAAWEPAGAVDCPAGSHGLLLHGLYVDPGDMHAGIGTRLLEAAREAASLQGFDGILVKAQSDSVGFFERLGLQVLPVEDSARHYAKRFWLPV
jgi:N-acetylglutamate synthase-like GNAT family acetyltransferase